MDRLKFWLEKFKFMAQFAWWGEWFLVSEEWKMTYADLRDAQSRSYEIYRESALRLLKGIDSEDAIRIVKGFEAEKELEAEENN